MAEHAPVFHALAAKETEAALDWYARRSPTAAAAFLMELNHAVRSVSDSPQKWPIHDKDIHKYVFPKFPFILYYKLIEERVHVLAVAHTKRRPDYWMNR